MKKIKLNRTKTMIASLKAVIFLFLFNLLSTTTVFAGNIQGSSLAKGLEKLIKDLTTWALVIAPIATVLAVIYFFIRKGMSDEMDFKKWDSRIKTAIISCVFAVLASVLVTLIVGYFQ